MKKNKVVVLGDPGVGKENIIEAIKGAPFEHKKATIGVEFLTHNTEGVRFEFWSTSGDQRYRSLAPMYVRDAKIVFLIYDLTSKKTFQALQEWLRLARENAEEFKLVVIGNKLDLASTQREVTLEEVAAFAKENDAIHLEVSAKKNTNIEQLRAALQQTEARAKDSVEEKQSSAHDSIEDLKAYATILTQLKDKEYFSSGPEKKAKAIKALLAQPITREVLEKILNNENDPLVKNRNILGNGFFRIKSKVLGHTNPLRKGRACVSDTEWKLVQIYNALPGGVPHDEDVGDSNLSEDSSSSSNKV